MVSPIDILAGVGLMVAAVLMYAVSITDWTEDAERQLLSFVITGFSLGGFLFLLLEFGVAQSLLGGDGTAFLVGGYIAILLSQLVRYVVVQKDIDVLSTDSS